VDVRWYCAEALHELLCQPGSSVQAAAAVLAAGGIQPLQQLLLGAMPGSRGGGSSRSSDEALWAASCAASCLFRIIRSSQQAARAAREAGVHRFMTRLLRAKDVHLRTTATAVLSTGLDQAAAAAAVDAGALEQLERLLAYPHLLGQLNAAAAVNNIIRSSPAADCKRLLQRLRRAPQLLLRLLESRSVRVQGAAAAALSACASSSPAAARRITGSPRAVQRLLQLLSVPASCTADINLSCSASHCIAAAVRCTGARAAAALTAAGVAPQPVQALQQAAAEAQQPGSAADGNWLEAALEALHALAACRDPGVSRRLVEAGALEALQQLGQPGGLGSGSSEEQGQLGEEAAGSSETSASLVGCLVLLPAALVPLLYTRRVVMGRAAAAARIRTLLLAAAAGGDAVGEGQAVPQAAAAEGGGGRGAAGHDCCVQRQGGRWPIAAAAAAGPTLLRPLRQERQQGAQAEAVRRVQGVTLLRAGLPARALAGALALVRGGGAAAAAGGRWRQHMLQQLRLARGDAGGAGYWHDFPFIARQPR
jgi:hypothetical protein